MKLPKDQAFEAKDSEAAPENLEKIDDKNGAAAEDQSNVSSLVTFVVENDDEKTNGLLKRLLDRVKKIGGISTLRPKPRRAWIRSLVLSFAVILLVYNGVQIIHSTQLTIEGLSRYIQLTYIDADENNQANTRHPYYTICPILNIMANLDKPQLSLVSVMLENSFDHPLVHYLSVFNPAE